MTQFWRTRKKIALLGIFAFVLQSLVPSLSAAGFNLHGPLALETGDPNVVIICTSTGIKKVRIDENGEPVEEEIDISFAFDACSHCPASCGGFTGVHIINTILSPAHSYSLSLPIGDNNFTNQCLSSRPPPRGPPLQS